MKKRGNQSYLKVLTLCLFIFAFLVLSSCSSTIAEIKKNPGRYNGNHIYVEGIVENVTLLIDNVNYFNYTPALYFYTITDNYDSLNVITYKKVYNGSYKSVNGKLIIFQHNIIHSELNSFLNEFTEYLINKNALPSSKYKESQKLFVSILASIINILTNGTMTSSIDTIENSAQEAIDSGITVEDKLFIQQVTQNLLSKLPKDEYYYVILED